MADDFHKPAMFGGSEFEAFAGSDDPAAIIRAAHETARALIARARESDDPAVIDRLVNYTDEHGIDALAELWARATPHSLPGALWRLYLVRLMIRQDPEGVALLFQRGTEVLATIDPVVAGAPNPAGPQEVLEVADRILRGVFEGDLGIALDRAAAFCRVESAGRDEHRRRPGRREPRARVRAHHARRPPRDDRRRAHRLRPPRPRRLPGLTRDS